MTPWDDAADWGYFILAGGQGRRMGGCDKPLLSLAGTPIIDHILHRLGGTPNPIAINTHNSAYQNWGYDIVADVISGSKGPLAGIHAGLCWAEEKGLKAIVTLAGDTPFFPQNLAAKMLETQHSEEADIILAQSEGRLHPVFGLWPTRLKAPLQAQIESDHLKIRAFTDQYRTRPCAFDITDGQDPFFNINRPEDLAKAEAILQDRDGYA